MFIPSRSLELWQTLLGRFERQRALRVAVLGIVLALVSLGMARGQVADYQIKAAFLYKFSGYIEWPRQAFDQPDSPIAIGVMGADSLADELANTAAGHMINGRTVVVRKVRRGNPVAGLHILFLSGSESERTAEVISALKDQAVLVVTDTDRFPAGVSMINFVLVNEKVRFDIALEPVEQSNLKISARLLAVARKVISRSS